MSGHLAWKLRDLVRCFRPAAFSAVAQHYDESYAERMDAFAQGRQSRGELELLLQKRSFCPVDRVLDFGCNTGRLTQALHAITGARVDGIDRNASSIPRARILFPHLTFHLYRGGVLPIESSCYDHVMLHHVIGHVEDPDQTLSEIVRVLVPGGSLNIVTPNRWYKCCMTLPNLVNRYRPDPTVLRYYTTGSLRSLVTRHGIDVEACQTMGEAGWPFGSAHGPRRLRMRVFLLGRKPA